MPSDASLLVISVMSAILLLLLMRLSHTDNFQQKCFCNLHNNMKNKNKFLKK